MRVNKEVLRVTIGQIIRCCCWLLCSWISLLYSPDSLAVPAKTVDVGQLLDGQVALGASLDYWIDVGTTAASTAQIIHDSDRLNWQTQSDLEPNFGFNPTPHWFRVRLQNQSDHDVQRLIELSYALLDEVDFYVIQNGQVIKHVQTGDQR
ncbi:MAG: 7TM-DISM domain-containing protein, partial [Flavobacteriales bacterium]